MFTVLATCVKTFIMGSFCASISTGTVTPTTWDQLSFGTFYGPSIHTREELIINQITTDSVDFEVYRQRNDEWVSQYGAAKIIDSVTAEYVKITYWDDSPPDTCALTLRMRCGKTIEVIEDERCEAWRPPFFTHDATFYPRVPLLDSLQEFDILRSPAMERRFKRMTGDYYEYFLQADRSDFLDYYNETTEIVEPFKATVSKLHVWRHGREFDAIIMYDEGGMIWALLYDSSISEDEVYYFTTSSQEHHQAPTTLKEWGRALGYEPKRVVKP